MARACTERYLALLAAVGLRLSRLRRAADRSARACPETRPNLSPRFTRLPSFSHAGSTVITTTAIKRYQLRRGMTRSGPARHTRRSALFARSRSHAGTYRGNRCCCCCCCCWQRKVPLANARGDDVAVGWRARAGTRSNELHSAPTACFDDDDGPLGVN